MELLFNEASLHGQFDIQSFQQAIGNLMAMRHVGRRYGRELQCNRNAINARVTPSLNMLEVVHTLPKDARSGLLRWLASTGPFWDDSRKHSESDWMECRGDIVTDTAIAEAAHAVLQERACGLVTASPSEWLVSPLTVDWKINGVDRTASVNNYWTIERLEQELNAAPDLVQSWAELGQNASVRFENLTFSDDSFAPLTGHPFSRAAARSILALLGILHDLKASFNERGERTDEGHRIYQEHFTGDNARFSDSSATEKAAFRERLTFPHPDRDGAVLFCSWHGKVNNRQLRIHFSSPVSASEPLYVVYVGPKISRR